MPWINPEEFKNLPEMHNIPFALSQCNGLGMGDAQGPPGRKNPVVRDYFSAVQEKMLVSVQSSHLSLLRVQETKKELYLNYLIVTRSSRTKGKVYLEGNVSSRAQTVLRVPIK